MEIDHFLAVDAGGTKCEALLMTSQGEAIAFHVVYPGQVSLTGDYGRGRDSAASLAAIQGVLRTANPAGVIHFVSGNGAMTQDFRHDLKASRVTLWHAAEAEAARAWAGVEDALVALSGTGAFGHLCMAGQNWHADGLGPLMGDWGGAYQIGRAGLRTALRDVGSPRLNGALRSALAREMGLIEDAGQLQNMMIREGIRIFADRTAVAHYSGMVDRTARAGDAAAVGILETAAADLAETLRFLVEQAGVATAVALPFIGTGGVIFGSDIYWNRLVQCVSTFLPNIRPLRQNLPQAAGLALTGLCQAVHAGEVKADVARVRERLCATLPALLRASDGKGSK